MNMENMEPPSSLQRSDSLEDAINLSRSSTQESTESNNEGALTAGDLKKIQELTESVFSKKSESNPNNWHAVYLTVPEGWDSDTFITACKANYKHILGSSQLSPGENCPGHNVDGPTRTTLSRKSSMGLSTTGGAS